MSKELSDEAFKAGIEEISEGNIERGLLLVGEANRMLFRSLEPTELDIEKQIILMEQEHARPRPPQEN